MWWGDSPFDARPLTLLAIGFAALVDVVVRLILLSSGISIDIVTALTSLVVLALDRVGLVLVAWTADWVFITAFVVGIIPHVFPPRMRETVKTVLFRAAATSTVIRSTCVCC